MTKFVSEHWLIDLQISKPLRADTNVFNEQIYHKLDSIESLTVQRSLFDWTGAQIDMFVIQHLDQARNNDNTIDKNGHHQRTVNYYKSGHEVNDFAL